MRQRTKIWIPMALAGALGYAMLGDDGPSTQVCYTNVDVNASFDTSGNIEVNVIGGTTSICNGLEEGDVCYINVETGTTLAANFNTNKGQFVFVRAIGTNRAATITSTQGITNNLGFAVVGVQGTSIAVEGDPKIQIVSSSCN